jgi:hypothetical protein
MAGESVTRVKFACVVVDHRYDKVKLYVGLVQFLASLEKGTSLRKVGR